jgi:hypothetical protein
VTTEGSTFDTVLTIYPGASVSNLALIAADDQSGTNNASRATFSATAGTAYLIAVDGFSGVPHASRRNQPLGKAWQKLLIGPRYVI